MHLLLVEPVPASRDYLIEHWARAGHRISSVGRDPSVAVHALVSRHESVRLGDRPATLRAAREIDAARPVDAVVTYSQAGVCAANWVTHALGLPPIWDDPDLDLRDKAAVAARWVAAGAPHPRTWEVTGPDDPVWSAVDFPVVVKPSSMMGGWGVRRCDTPDEARRWVSLLLEGDTWRAAGQRIGELFAGYGMRPSVIVQQLLSPDPVGGSRPEFTLECVVNDGDIHPIGSFQKDHSAPPFFEERTFIFPAPDLTPRQSDLLRRTAQDAVSALGFRWGVCHLEMCLQDGAPRLFEINPRLIGETTAKVLNATVDTHVGDVITAVSSGQPSFPRRREGLWGGSVHVCAGDEFAGTQFVGLAYEPDKLLEEWIDLNRPIGYTISPPRIRRSQILARVGFTSRSLPAVRARLAYWNDTARIRTRR